MSICQDTSGPLRATCLLHTRPESSPMFPGSCGRRHTGLRRLWTTTAAKLVDTSKVRLIAPPCRTAASCTTALLRIACDLRLLLVLYRPGTPLVRFETPLHFGRASRSWRKKVELQLGQRPRTFSFTIPRLFLNRERYSSSTSEVPYCRLHRSTMTD